DHFDSGGTSRAYVANWLAPPLPGDPYTSVSVGVRWVQLRSFLGPGPLCPRNREVGAILKSDGLTAHSSPAVGPPTSRHTSFRRLGAAHVIPDHAHHVRKR